MKWISKPPLGTPLNWTHPLNKGLAGFWLFNEGMGNKAYDLSGNRNHGTLTNMAFPPTATSGWNPGRKGIGLRLDGTNDYINAGSAANLHITDKISIELLFKKVGNNSSGGNPRIMWKERYVNDTDNGAYGFALSNAGSLVFSLKNNNNGISSGFTVSDNVWYHTVGTYDGSNQRLYIDGVLKDTDTNTIGIGTHPSAVLFIGSSSTSNGHVNILIDEARIWNRILSASEAQTLYMDPYGMFL